MTSKSLFESCACGIVNITLAAGVLFIAAVIVYKQFVLVGKALGIVFDGRKRWQRRRWIVGEGRVDDRQKTATSEMIWRVFNWTSRTSQEMIWRVFNWTSRTTSPTTEARSTWSISINVLGQPNASNH